MTELASTAPDLWSTRFRRERESSWRELDKIVTGIEAAGLRSLRPDALSRLPTLYRAASSALSVARASCLDRNLLDYLENLTARAHLCVYSPRESVTQALGAFFRWRFPSVVRAAWLPFAIASATLAIGFAIAFTMCTRDLEGNYHYFISMQRTAGRDPGATYEDLRETLFASGDDGELSAFAAFLWSHNSHVTLLAFGLAILGGVPGLLLVLVTGFEIGAMSALFHQSNLGIEWWSWLLPHGITELLAVLLGTVAGMRLAGGLLFSGPHGRLAALARLSQEAGPLMFGAILMLFLAGQIEGIFRQSVQDITVRYSLAALTAGLWGVYFLWSGRRPR